MQRAPTLKVQPNVYGWYLVYVILMKVISLFFDVISTVYNITVYF